MVGSRSQYNDPRLASRVTTRHTGVVTLSCSAGIVRSVAAITLVATLVLAPAVSAATTTQPTTTQPTPTQPAPPSSLQGAPAPAPRIIPEPNSGSEPRDYGDRGGVGQSAVFFGVCGALLAIGGLVVLESRRKLRRATSAGTEP